MTPGLNRRRFLAMAAGGLAAAGWLWRGVPRPVPQRRAQAIAFDAFTIFDPRPISALAETLFPGKGTEVSLRLPAMRSR